MNPILGIFIIPLMLFEYNWKTAKITPSAAEKTCICSYLESAGTYMPYPEPISKEESAPPKGYVPFFINHIGRHGGGTISSSESIDYLLFHLQEAAKVGKLTSQGSELHSQLRKLKETLNGHWGELTTSGHAEQVGIAHRLAARYPELFKHTNGSQLTITAISSPVARCMNSMYVFVNNIKNISHSNIIVKTTYNKENLPILDFFNLNSSYIRYYNKGNWRERFSQFKRQKLNPERIIALIFKPTYKVNFDIQCNFVLALFGTRNALLNDSRSLNLNQYFSSTDLISLWSIRNVWDYLSHAGSGEDNFLAIRVAAPLLMDIITTTDKAILSQKQLATLRFAHAETLIPLIALMGIPEGVAHIANPHQLCRYWRNFEVAPMAANLQWIFYQDPSGNVIVKVLLNEKETTLPIESNIAPYYSWNKVKRYYSEQLIRILPTL